MKMNFVVFHAWIFSSSKTTPLEVTLCGESIASIPDAQKIFSDHVSGISVGFHAYFNYFDHF
jgi:hypothetical protein